MGDRAISEIEDPVLEKRLCAQRICVNNQSQEEIALGTTDFIGLYEEYLGFLLGEVKTRTVPRGAGHHGLGLL